MSIKYIILSLLACLAMTGVSQPVQQQEQWDWYLGEVVNDVFVGRNYFEYYYMPSAADMEQQRARGEVSYFLNSPAGLSLGKVRSMIDRLMASYDDIRAVNAWQTTSTTCWREFRFENNKFRFTVKRKALDDGTYYVSATETASYYKSLGKSKNQDGKAEAKAKKPTANDKPSKRSHRGRRAITLDDEEAAADSDNVQEEADAVPVMSEKQRRAAAREREDSIRLQQRLAKQYEEEQQREAARKQKLAEKQKKAEEKQKKEEEKRLKKEEEKQRREQARKEREQAARERAAQREKAAAPKPVESKYHYSDVALWLSEKYDFTQTSASASGCTMYSTAVKDVEMAKLAIKNALKGSNARMAVPWRLNDDTQAVETGYTVDDHVLVFAIGTDEAGRVTLSVTEVSNEQFEDFKQQLNEP